MACSNKVLSVGVFTVHVEVWKVVAWSVPEACERPVAAFHLHATYLPNTDTA
jgi:hypothetical protein